MTIEAAIFDVFGTVVDWRRGVAEAVAPAFAARGIALAPERFADAWRAEYQPGMAPIRAGTRGYTPLDVLHRENLDRALVACGLGEIFDGPERDALNTAWEKLPPWPDSVPGIAAMRRRLLVAPCSNGSIALMARLARFGGLEWDAILGAEIAQTYKPEPEVYLRAAAALRLPPGQVVMVAAHNDDLAAARAAGLATAFVPRPAEHGPGQRSDLAPEADWDFVAPEMTALAERLAG
ncbi:haloacid dehalogenase type II [Paralimibaculum aggregatum]|uniref:(S)-2-haloacid dehalogenase n=1 Tax=Paralimibaculum aggregatum TaxID=3036245 RepID=A0ABQ6LQ06_9RHOB|nr:haloacid dehalogenase type II [Limibaculum sp. NKW23]GMG82510.1 haloacid dehalogenase type II [Limibaculum sp. NKW23]